jgi:hypothetical protein
VPFKAGHCFLYPLTGFETAHIWVIATEPNADGQFAIVNFTSLKGNKDQTVILRKGEHEFITHDTCVNYWAADISSIDVLQAMLECGQARMERDLDETLLKLIQQGFTASDLTKNRIADFVRKHK